MRPPDWYWTAVRENDPATGNPEKKAAERLARPRARSSWFESILYFSFVATALATEIDSIKTHEGHDEGGRDECPYNTEVDGGYGKGRQPARHLPDDTHATSIE